MKYLCSICVRRDAIGWEWIDGKKRPCCYECAEVEVDDPGDAPLFDELPAADQVLRVLRHMPGATFGDLRLAMSIPEDAADHTIHRRYERALTRLVESGYVRRDDYKGEHSTYTALIQERPVKPKNMNWRAEYQRQRIADLEARGLCRFCMNENDRDRSRCSACWKRELERRRQRRNAASQGVAA